MNDISDYSKGLRHGRADLARMVAEILDDNITDEEKIQQLRHLTAAATERDEEENR